MGTQDADLATLEQMSAVLEVKSRSSAAVLDITAAAAKADVVAHLSRTGEVELAAIQDDVERRLAELRARAADSCVCGWRVPYNTH